MTWMDFVPWGLVETITAGAIASYVLNPVLNFFHVSAQSKVRADLDAALHNALQYGIANIKGKPEDILKDDDLWNDLLNTAKDYLADNADGLLNKIGLDPQHDAVVKALEARVLTAVNNYVYQNGQIVSVANDPTQATPGNTINVPAPAAS